MPYKVAQSRQTPYLLLLVLFILLLKVVHFSVSYYSLEVALPNTLGPASGKFPMVAWDSNYYMAIMMNGYPDAYTDHPEFIAFFPLYPLIAYPLTYLMPPTWALLLVSQLFSFAAFLLIFVWARDLLNEKAAFWTAVLIAAYYPAYVVSAAYTEGLFLFLIALTLRLLQKDATLSAALVTGIACACRPNGIALAIAVFAWTLSREKSLLNPRSVGKVLVLGMVSVSGLMAYELFLTVKYGAWDIYFKAQEQGWKFEDHLEWRMLLFKKGTLVILFFSTLLLIGIYNNKALAPLFLIPFVTLAMAANPLHNSYASLDRLMICAVPCFFVIARLSHYRIGSWLLGAGCLASIFVQCWRIWSFTRGETFLSNGVF